MGRKGAYLADSQMKFIRAGLTLGPGASAEEFSWRS